MTDELEEKQKWNILRSKLNQDYKYNQFWEDAIKLFGKAPISI